MTKRVSLKGKGADIFFGDFTPTTASEVPPATEAPDGEVPPASPVDSAPVDSAPQPATTSDALSANSMHPSKKARVEESVHARTRARKQEPVKNASWETRPIGTDLESVLSTPVLDGIWSELAAPATLTNAFRYTEQELSALTDATYEVGKSHRVKVSKQDIARLGLNAVLWDYRVRGDESLLGQLIRRRKQQRQGSG